MSPLGRLERQKGWESPRATSVPFPPRDEIDKESRRHNTLRRRRRLNLAEACRGCCREVNIDPGVPISSYIWTFSEKALSSATTATQMQHSSSKSRSSAREPGTMSALRHSGKTNQLTRAIGLTCQSVPWCRFAKPDLHSKAELVRADDARRLSIHAPKH